MSHRFSQYGQLPLAFVILLGGLLTSSVGAELAINVQPLFTKAGPARHTTYFPGEQLGFAVIVKGLTPNPEHSVALRYTYKLLNEAGESMAGLTDNCQLKSALGGTSLVLHGVFNVPSDVLPGKFQVHVEIVDQQSGGKASVKLPVDIVAPAGPYLVQLGFASEMTGTTPHSGTFVVGETAFLNFRMMGLRSDSEGQYTCKLQCMEAGKVVGELMQVSVQSKSLVTSSGPAQFYFPLTREFKGVARLELSSDRDDSKCVVDIPFQVLPLNTDDTGLSSRATTTVR